MLCTQCNHLCLTCNEFENIITSETDIDKLKSVRQDLAKYTKDPNMTISEKVAVTLVAFAFSMKFFVFCNILSFIPVLAVCLKIPAESLDLILKVLNFISSNWLQLIYLPLIGMAGIRTQKVNDLRSKREYRMLLISDRIDELHDSENKE